MSNKPQVTKWAQIIVQEYLDNLMSFRPDISLTDLRILNLVHLSKENDDHLGVLEISKQLDIPISTASRSVKRSIEKGQLYEEEVQDGRYKSIRPNPSDAESVNDWAKVFVKNIIRAGVSQLPDIDSLRALELEFEQLISE